MRHNKPKKTYKIMIDPYLSCIQKQTQVKELFKECHSEEEKYQKIIHLGQELDSLPDEFQKEDYVVHGCQSTMYLRSWTKDDKVWFQASSDALISKGLAALLIAVYSGEPAEAILKCPPQFLDELGIASSLTLNRANGLYSIHLRMKQEAIKTFLPKK